MRTVKILNTVLTDTGREFYIDVVHYYRVYSVRERVGFVENLQRRRARLVNRGDTRRHVYVLRVQ